MPENSKILIADDSVFMRKVVVEALKSAGYSNFIEAENGKQAIDLFHSAKPDLILLDVIMPEMDGLEVMKNIGSEANIIIVSAIGQEGIIEEALGLGAKGFLVKPFDKDKLIFEVKKFLGS